MTSTSRGTRGAGEAQGLVLAILVVAAGLLIPTDGVAHS